MTAFFGTTIFIGIILILFVLAWIAFDKKNSLEYKEQFEEKKEELVNVINDAEQMLFELNKFSDYIVTQMDTKSEEVFSKIKGIEEKINDLKFIDNNLQNLTQVSRNEIAFKSSNLGIKDENHSPVKKIKSDLIVENLDIDSVEEKSVQSNINVPKNDKVIPMRYRHKEVVTLAKNGLNDTEIARKLNMGKGEIQLILGVSK